MEQADLVDRARRGDHDAFAGLANAAIVRLDGAARLLLRDPDRPKDAVQDALVRAWRDLPNLRDPARFDAWLYRILVNKCHAERRRSWRHLEVDIDTILPPTVPDGTAGVADRDQLARGFRRLAPDQRAVIVLYHYVGLSLIETGEALGVPLGTVKSRLHRATQILRGALAADARDRTATEGRLA